MSKGYVVSAVTVGTWSAAATIERFGGDEALVRELVGLFVESCPRWLESLRARLRDNDLPALAKSAHAFKGSVSNFTREGAAATALQLEQVCATGRQEAAAATLQRLEQDVQKLIAAMRSFLNS
jgi:protein-histidine pros-kinase